MANGSFLLPFVRNLKPSAIKSVGFSTELSLFPNPDIGRLFNIEVYLTDSAATTTGYKLFQIAINKTYIGIYGQKTNSSWTTFGEIR